MSVDLNKLDDLLAELANYQATLIAVSKTKPIDVIEEVYTQRHLHFGENYVQELIIKQAKLPSDINWHFIGHLQSNKVKMIAPFVKLIHGIDSRELLEEVSKQALKNNRIIDVLLQVHISDETTKFGMSKEEVLKLAEQLIHQPLPGLAVRGLMGMASFTEQHAVIRQEFRSLKNMYDEINLNSDKRNSMDILSMGMSTDYKIALGEGSTMVRIGSAIFGDRN